MLQLGGEGFGDADADPVVLRDPGDVGKDDDGDAVVRCACWRRLGSADWS